MKRNVNFLLLGLVLFTVIAMAGLAFYYKYTYDDLKERYENSRLNILTAAEELNRTIAEVNAKEELLNQKESILINYINELNLSKERETSLGTHFTDIKNENVYLQEKLNKTILDRERWETMYTVTKNEYDVCKVDYELEKAESRQRLDEIYRIRGLKPSLETSAERIESRGEEVDTNAGRIDSKASEIKSLADGINDSALRNEIKSKADEIKSYVDLIENVLATLEENIEELRRYIASI